MIGMGKHLRESVLSGNELPLYQCNALVQILYTECSPASDYYWGFFSSLCIVVGSLLTEFHRFVTDKVLVLETISYGVLTYTNTILYNTTYTGY